MMLVSGTQRGKVGDNFDLHVPKNVYAALRELPYSTILHADANSQCAMYVVPYDEYTISLLR